MQTNSQQDVNKSNYAHFFQLLAGASAGISSKTLTAPLERLRTLYQVQTTSKTPSILTGLSSMYSTGGSFKSMFRGNLAACIKVAPSSALKFYTYENLKKFVSGNDPRSLTSQQIFVCGSLAGILSHTLFYPLDVVKTRLSATYANTYRNISHVVLDILASGDKAQFYRGLGASLLSTIPSSGINLTVYEFCRKVLVPFAQQLGHVDNGEAEQSTIYQSTLTTLAVSVSGGTAAVVSMAFVYPLKTVKSRLIMRGHGTTPLYTGYLDVVRLTKQHEGISGFYKGFTPGLLKSVPAHIIGYTMYDSLRRAFSID